MGAALSSVPAINTAMNLLREIGRGHERMIEYRKDIEKSDSSKDIVLTEPAPTESLLRKRRSMLKTFEKTQLRVNQIKEMCEMEQDITLDAASENVEAFEKCILAISAIRAIQIEGTTITDEETSQMLHPSERRFKKLEQELTNFRSTLEDFIRKVLKESHEFFQEEKTRNEDLSPRLRSILVAHHVEIELLVQKFRKNPSGDWSETSNTFSTNPVAINFHKNSLETSLRAIGEIVEQIFSSEKNPENGTVEKALIRVAYWIFSAVNSYRNLSNESTNFSTTIPFDSMKECLNWVFWKFMVIQNREFDENDSLGNDSFDIL